MDRAKPQDAVKPKPKAALPTARLAERRDFNPELAIMWWEPSIPFTHKPGQYCTIGLGGIERPYSIASAPGEERIEIFVELVPHGELTPLLWPLQVGDEVTLRPRPKGVFTMYQQFPNQLMVATVTGVAPYVSMLRDYLNRGASGHHFYVLDGASYQEELVYREELTELAKRHPKLVTYAPTISRPGDERNRSWQGEQQRVNLIVDKCIDQFGLDPSATVAYACGNPGMIEDVKERLTPKGFKVREERFWKE